MLSDVSSAGHLFDPLSARSKSGYVRDIWSMRRYAWELGRSSIRASNSSTSLGSLWLFLEPIFSISVYFVVFGLLLEVSRGIENYLAFLVVGQVTFGLGQRALLGAAGSLERQAPMMQALSFPRAVLPLSEVLKAGAAYRTEAVVMFLVLPLIGEVPRITSFLIVPIVMVQLVTALGMGMGLARLVRRFGDVQRLLTHLMRLTFYGSGVFFPLSAFTDSAAVLLGVVIVNPFYNHLELSRWAIIGTPIEHPVLSVTMALFWALFAITAGGWFFRSAEGSYAAKVVPG